MPTFYNFRENGLDYSFDDIFVPADLFRDGTLWTWGSGSYGQLGNAVTTDRSTPVTTRAGGTNWKQVSSSYYHTAAIKTDGTLWLWGQTTYGSLGNGDSTFGNKRSTPITTFAGGTNWKQVSCSHFNTTAIKTDGTLWTWGYGNDGALGNATLTSRSTPVTTFTGGTNWKQVSAGGRYTTAIKTDGTLWTWGNGNNAELGNATIVINISTPITTFAGGTNWKQVSAGKRPLSNRNIVAAIKTDGTLWTWGYGRFGKLGDSDEFGFTSTPITTFAGGNNWKQVSVGIDIVGAIKTDGTLWTWGYGSFGRLGNARVTNVNSTPSTTFAGGTNWKQVRAGYAHMSAIKTDGTLWIWGRSFDGQLGNADTTDRSTPITTFAGGTNWKQVSCGYQQTAAVTYDDPVI